MSATANAGALGILASATMTFDQLAAAIREVQARTDRPFGVNLRADAEDADARVDLLVREHVPVASFAARAARAPDQDAQGRGRSRSSRRSAPGATPRRSRRGAPTR